MDREYMKKLVEMVKKEKIIINQKGELAFSEEYLQKKRKRKISSVSKEKNKVYSKEGVKLSEKVYFSVLKSGELKLRGGRKNAQKLNEELKKEIKSKRIGEVRRDVYKAISIMLDKYIQELEEKANKKDIKSKNKKEIKKAKAIEVPSDDVVIEETVIKSVKSNASKESMDKNMKEDTFAQVLNIPSSEEEKYQHFAKYYNMLDKEQKYQIKFYMLGNKGLLNKLRARFTSKKLERKLILQLESRYEAMYEMAYMVDLNNAKKNKTQVEETAKKRRKSLVSRIDARDIVSKSAISQGINKQNVNDVNKKRTIGEPEIQ